MVRRCADATTPGFTHQPTPYSTSRVFASLLCLAVSSGTVAEVRSVDQCSRPLHFKTYLRFWFHIGLHSQCSRRNVSCGDRRPSRICLKDYARRPRISVAETSFHREAAGLKLSPAATMSQHRCRPNLTTSICKAPRHRFAFPDLPEASQFSSALETFVQSATIVTVFTCTLYLQYLQYHSHIQMHTTMYRRITKCLDTMLRSIIIIRHT